ncbi:MAG: Chemotaxis protein CheW [Deltaproteobacteria bacterium ADurb.Bin510]|nr:MAG: Chemotaxis protein CheW [Deltaproteobacteria bacterium ADurb.Bin510]
MQAVDGTEATQYLSFKLADEDFALDIAQVREVLDLPSITAVPRTQGFVKGVINLRGAVVPVVDLRLKFGMNTPEPTVNTRVIITEIDLDDDPTVLGALADSVQEVMELESLCIETPPKLGIHIKTEYLKGMGKRGDEFVMILDLDKIISLSDFSAVSQAGES